MVGLLSVLFVSLCLQAAAQEAGYTVTETELTELESILMSLQTSRQMQQSQVRSLQEGLKAAHKRAESLQETLLKSTMMAQHLNGQLQTEREALKRLRQSYNVYEREAAAILESKQAENERLQHTLYRRTIALVVSISLLIGISLLTLVKWYFKNTLRLFPP